MPQARDEAGNIWEYDSLDAQGNPVNPRLVTPAAPQMPADPSFPYEGAQAQAQAANTGAQAAVNQATVPAQITAAQADATSKTRTAQTAGLPEGFMWGPDGKTAVPIPGYSRQGISPEIRSQAIQAFNDAVAIERAADQIEEMFKAGPGQTSGPRGIQDYFPTAANQRLNDAAQRARGYVKRSLGFTGGEGNTIAESSALYDPYLPDSWDRDVKIEDKIAALRQLGQDARNKSVMTLGGIPDESGNIQPLPNAMTMPRAVEGAGPGAAPSGSDTQGIPVDPRYQAEFSSWVQSKGGNFSPQEYNDLRRTLDRKYGYGSTGDYTGEAQQVIDAFKTGRTVNLTIPPVEQPLSGLDQFRNDLVNNPIGAALVGGLDMGGFGGVSALAPEQMAALGEAQPVGTTVGQIGGAITGTGALARGGKFLAERVPGASRLLGGGTGAQVARNVGTDAAYSGIYGANTGQDPLESAAWGAGGSLVGQGAGSAVGRAIGGVDLAPAVQFLRQRGIPMTVPQQVGGFVKGIEDKAMSMPLVGDMIRARRMEGLGAFNREAFNEAGGPINATVSEIGQEGIEQLGDQVGDAYTNATQGASVPFDPQFQTDFAAAVGQGQRLPPDLRRGLGEILDARVAPITDTGTMTGEQFQQALRALKATRNRPPSRFEGFEEDYRNAVSGVMDSLEGQMMRGGGQGTVEGLTAANAANRNFRTVEDAATRAAGGSGTEMPFVFTPSQLQRAALATKKKYPGPRPFEELTDAAQEVLPSRVPNSGTADRAAQMLTGGSILSGGAGLGALAGGDLEGAGTGAGLSTAAMLALLAGGTKTGQRALQRAIIDRPATMKQLGRQIRNRTGLFGSASLPFVVADY